MMYCIISLLYSNVRYYTILIYSAVYYIMSLYLRPTVIYLSCRIILYYFIVFCYVYFFIVKLCLANGSQTRGRFHKLYVDLSQ